MDPNLLLALLSSPLVKSQIFAKRFTQDIIDTLGGRWRELVLPMPNNSVRRKEITDVTTQDRAWRGADVTGGSVGFGGARFVA